MMELTMMEACKCRRNDEAEAAMRRNAVRYNENEFPLTTMPVEMREEWLRDGVNALGYLTNHINDGMTHDFIEDIETMIGDMPDWTLEAFKAALFVLDAAWSSPRVD